jgi:hypothetical protein
MSTPAFTPGPWDVESTRNPNADYMTWREIKAEDSGGKSIVLAEVYMDSNLMEPTNEQARANSRLIAAAPELYEALGYLRDYGCPVCSGDCGSANPPVTACPMQKVSAALAKARGE